ncbi:MAG: DsrE family protein [Chromatiaceae bacterium]|nr:DsrE family protein [Gammaproteobacteria bacterium]MCP5445452.1 DsrE family protein [Chromatiaceae bacterium]MCB1862282.1 DsrE family protein [Gammaproteobacteria bacterium]MCB1873599.1 DsrE family protein [Gammaproteobacteria bacterium]MCB1879705.1 DsrE family protein [Gammaproteobacteria bacterium]
MKRLSTIILAGLVGLMAWTGIVTAAGEGTKQKVVYHINGDDPKQQAGALRNIQNHINAVGKEHLDLRVVMHGNGVSMVLLPEALANVKGFKHANADQQMQANIDGLKSQGVAFNVCANTLEGRKVSREGDLYMVDEADIVPSGVAQLAILQGQGFAYIKP